MSDILFNEPVVGHFRSPDLGSSSSRREVVVNAELSIDPTTQKKELGIRLTDESDPFFLFSLHLGEDDFQSLKSEQGLLVDFSAFPQKLVELLRLCLKEQNCEIPRYVLQLSYTAATSSAINPSLVMSVVETNPFKHLVHLALKVLPANDKEIKRYLADSLKTSKQEASEAKRQASKIQEALTSQLQCAQQSLAVRSAEVERLKAEWSERDAELKSQFDQTVEAEHQKALADKATERQRYDRDREAFDQAHKKLVRELEGRLKETSMEAKQLAEKCHSLQLSVREWQSKASNYKDEFEETNSHLTLLRKEAAALLSEKHQIEKEFERCQTRLDAMTEQLRDKEANLSRCQHLLDDERASKHSLEEALEVKRAKETKHAGALAHLKQEVSKANEMIARLKDNNNELREKVKLGCQVAEAQEVKLAALQKSNDEFKSQTSEAAIQLSGKDEQVKLLRREIEERDTKLEDAKEKIASQEQMISYLGRQLNEKQLNTFNGLTVNSTTPSSTTLANSKPSSLKRVTFHGESSSGENLGDTATVNGMSNGNSRFYDSGDSGDSSDDGRPGPTVVDTSKVSIAEAKKPSPSTLPLAERQHQIGSRQRAETGDVPLDSKYFQPPTSPTKRSGVANAGLANLMTQLASRAVAAVATSVAIHPSSSSSALTSTGINTSALTPHQRTAITRKSQ